VLRAAEIMTFPEPVLGTAGLIVNVNESMLAGVVASSV
jgi:hypothetical protein